MVETYKVRSGYHVRLGNAVFKPGDTLVLTDEEFEERSHLVELVSPKDEAKAPDGPPAHRAIKRAPVKK